jgi:hypothetical protein
MDKPSVRERFARHHNLSIEHVNNMTTQEMYDMNVISIYYHAKSKYDALMKRRRLEAKQNKQT